MLQQGRTDLRPRLGVGNLTNWFGVSVVPAGTCRSEPGTTRRDGDQCVSGYRSLLWGSALQPHFDPYFVGRVPCPLSIAELL